MLLLVFLTNHQNTLLRIIGVKQLWHRSCRFFLFTILHLGSAVNKVRIMWGHYYRM